MKDAKPVEAKGGNCLVCHKLYKAPYARVGGLGVCCRAHLDQWNKQVEDGKHPQGDDHYVRTLPSK